MIFCETWLTDQIDSNHICIPDYKEPLRSDRQLKRGGGVCICPKADVACRMIPQLDRPPPFVECVWTAHPQHKSIVLAIYVPPNLNSSQLIEVIDYIISQAETAMNIFEDCKLVVAGDLNNLPTSLLETTLSLSQCVRVPTRGTAILDKILVDDSLCDNFHEPVIGANFGNADHRSVIMRPKKEKHNPSQVKKVYDLRNSHLNAFIRTLKCQPWQKLYYSDGSIDVKCDMFYNFVNQALDCIPFSYVLMTARDKPWITPILKLLINRRYEAYYLGHFEKYHHYKNKIKLEIKKSKAAWLTKLKKSPHGVWKAIPSYRGKDTLLDLVGQFGSTVDLANALNSVLSSVFTDSGGLDFAEIRAPFNEEDWNIKITTEKVSEMLRNLKKGKSPGNDNLCPRLLRAAHEVLAGPLAHLFVLSTSSGRFPNIWKTAVVAPIPKKRNPSLSEFRPISLLTIPSKILETMVLNSVKPHLIAHYGNCQFGFRPKSSTLNAHLTIQDFVTRQLDISSVKGVVMVAMDLSKAFDRLSHRSLIQSLSDASLPKKFILWLADFLSNRKQRVIIQGVTSENVTNVTSGVPQGSVLAPYIFAFHMGTLSPSLPQTLLVKYADDVSILIPFNDPDELSTSVLKEVENIKKWCASHGLKVNEEKTKSLVFRSSKIDDISLKSIPNVSSQVKVLGVTFEASLKWDLHIESVTKSASRRTYVLRTLKKIQTVTKADLLQVYHNYILGILEYNSPLFVGLSSKNEQRMERLARRCHRVICGMDCRCADFEHLRDRRLARAMKEFIKMMDPSNICNSLLPHRLPRTKHFFISHMKTDRRAKSFVPYCCLIWNAHT